MTLLSRMLLALSIRTSGIINNPPIIWTLCSASRGSYWLFSRSTWTTCLSSAVTFTVIAPCSASGSISTPNLCNPSSWTSWKLLMSLLFIWRALSFSSSLNGSKTSNCATSLVLSTCLALHSSSSSTLRVFYTTWSPLWKLSMIDGTIGANCWRNTEMQRSRHSKNIKRE